MDHDVMRAVCASHLRHFPIHGDGASTVLPGLYFVGTHFLRKRKSSTLLGMGEDAAVIASSIANRIR